MSANQFKGERAGTKLNSIGIIVTWFGVLPPYFSGWLKSAEANETIDFHIISDQEIYSGKNNIFVYRTTLEEEIKKFSRILNREVSIEQAYKFCDCRLFFGNLYQDILHDYDFWGYCDIDLMFGDIRAFVTDEVMEKNDRIYPYGHLGLYRNTEKMNHLYDIPGGIYSYDEIFTGTAKTTPEEYFGANRICIHNQIAWYTKIDFADLNLCYPRRLEQVHGKINHPKQIFMWEDGKAYRVYQQGNCMEREELVYIHWQKRNPHIRNEEKFQQALQVVITAEELVPVQEITEAMFDVWNPNISVKQKKLYRRIYYRSVMKRFLHASGQTKRIWLRQMRYRICERGMRRKVYN